jgi:hypothetical protein
VEEEEEEKEEVEEGDRDRWESMLRGVLNYVAGTAGARDDKARNTRDLRVLPIPGTGTRGGGQHRSKHAPVYTTQTLLNPTVFDSPHRIFENKYSGLWQGARAQSPLEAKHCPFA